MGRPIRVNKRSKYHNRKVMVDGIMFASHREAKRYGELALLVKDGRITNLTLQPRFPCVVNDRLVCVYIADFRYFDKDRGVLVIEDVKGFRTDVYKLKAKLVEAIYDIVIVEV